MDDSAKRLPENGQSGIWLSVEQVNDILNFLINVPYKYSRPVIKVIEEEVVKQNG